MVISSKIRCDACDVSFYIKYQIDEMIYLYPWNLAFCCPECGNQIQVRCTAKGLNCKRDNVKEEYERAYLIGYSSCLPITKEMYLPITNFEDRLASFSPFLNLTLNPRIGLDAIQNHGAFIKGILDNVFEYRHSLSELLPILSKPKMKPEAYTKKIAKVFNLKNYKNELTTYTECVAHYAEMINCCYINIRPITIADAPYGTLFEELMKLSFSISKVDAELLKNEINQYSNLKDWLIKKAFKYIADMIGKIERYFPAMFYGVTGDYLYPRQSQLYLVTINYDEVNDDYRKGYEVLEKILPAVVALENKLNRGEVNNFGSGLTYTMNDFTKLTAGTKVGIIQKNDVLKSYFMGSLNNKIRNSETHDDSDYESENQICRYIDINNPEDIVEFPLMDVAFMTYIQFVHIMEISLVINAILQRTWN